MDRNAFFSTGYARIPHCPETAAWAEHARDVGRAALGNSELAQWYRYEKTWFAGVNALGNQSDGQLAGGPPLTGLAMAPDEA